ncbi:centrosomal protein of 192 kDa-like [Phacochoerus africanus]|uniref:centrosomal protein of 192 kDa-like n=1 Tax=Phacochoerus africanus TaxID=41426 RepID=UPI001FD94946|nr:centrosomal protein of 192 kDa-like [Phacochoerus africanus]
MNKENKVVVPDAGKPFEEREPNSDLSHTSFLENERLMALASLEESSDDDIDDEEFYDDHLEAYFEQLAIPGMMYEDLEGQEPPEHYFKLPTSDPSQADKNSVSLLSHGSCSSGSSEIPCGESGGGHVCPSATHSSVCPGDSRGGTWMVCYVFPLVRGELKRRKKGQTG